MLSIRRGLSLQHLSVLLSFIFISNFSTLQAQTCSWDYLGAQGVSAGTGEWTELEYHPLTNELYLAFQDEANGSKITVMKFDGNAWSTVGTPGISAGEAYHPDLEFDSAGNIYVLYRGLPNYSYTVKTFDGVNWVSLGGDNFTGASNGNGTLAIHPLTDELYIAYPDLEESMQNRLSVCKFDGANWNFVGAQGITATGIGYPDIQFDALGTPYVACSVFADDAKISVLSFDGANWNFVGSPAFSNNTSSNSSYGAALQFNPVTGEPWVVSRVSGNIADVYSFSGGSWSDETLPNYVISNFNQRIGFRFTPEGVPFFALKRNNGSPLFVASVIAKKEGVWDYVGNNQISEDLVTYVAMTLSPEGEPVVAFRDDSAGGAGKISVMKASCVITGCTDPTACNYNEEATEDDGSCLTLYGCTDPAACNYDVNAECDDASCNLPDGCTDATAYNFDPAATCDDGTCIATATGIHFVGNDDRVFFDDVDGFNASSFTIQIMYNIGAVSNYATLFHLGDSEESALEIYTQTNSNIAVVFNRNNAAPSSSKVVTNLPTGTWFMLTVTYDENDDLDIYYNSNLVGSQNMSVPPSITEDTKGWIGHMPSNNWGQLTSAVGNYDELRVWNRKLSTEEVQLQLNCELDGTNPDLFAYYSFNQGGLAIDNSTETTVLDQTGNGHDGTLQNMALTGTTSNWSTGSELIAGTCALLVQGCTDDTACNYNPDALIDDGSCLFIAGCTDPSACNYNESAQCDDGSCDLTSCIGCTDPLAENYELDNTTDDGSCIYCPATLTYDAVATEQILIGDGISNEHMAISSNCNVSASIKANERFTGDIVPTDGVYRILSGESPTSGVDPTPDPGKAKWNYVFSANLGAFTAEEVKIYLDVDFDPAVAAGSLFTADVTQVLIDNGLATSSLAQDSQNLGFDFWQAIGDPAISAFDPFANGLYDLTLRIESLAGVELVNAPIQVEVYTLGCTDPLACNYNANASEDDGSCLNAFGCTDNGACNYDPAANCDDGSCEFTSCLGCTDANSCDFDPTALIDDGSCAIYPGDACDDGNVYTENDLIQADCGCVGTPIDSDGDGLSDEEEITVYNTDPFIQDSDYDGLTDGLEINLAGTSPLNPDSDGDGCGDAESFAGLCPGQEVCPGDFNNDNFINATDLLVFLGTYGSSCD